MASDIGTEIISFDDSLISVFPSIKGGNAIIPLKTLQSSSFDFRFFYVRAYSCCLEDAPDALTMYYFPKSIHTSIEMNGGRIFHNHSSCLILSRNRMDRESSEVTYVSTDSFRIIRNLSFEIVDKDDLFICGNLKRTLESKVDQESQCQHGWKMECTCVMGLSECSFSRNRPMLSALSRPPMNVEVYFAGQVSGLPAVLTESVKLSGRQKYLRHEILGTIADDDREQLLDSLVAEELAKGSGRHIPLLYTGLADRRTVEWDVLEGGCEYEQQGIFSEEDDEFCRFHDYGYLEGEEGQFPWLKAGVRFGLGIGLGICVGLGIGAGILVRTYQSTAKTFNRRTLTRRKFL